MTRDEIDLLAARIASGEANESEILLYNRLYNYMCLPEESEAVFDQERAELEMQIKAVIWRKTGIVKPLVRRTWFQWGVAASIILAVSISFWVLNERHVNKQPVQVTAQQKRFKNDVDPGQQGAILTLSSGKTIILDSAHNGSLVKEGATEILKENGELVYSGQSGSNQEVYNTMTTPKGRQYSLVLTDGTRVWLNASSSITYPTVFSGKERKVSITGEAYFEVAHNDLLPFIVQKGEASINVLGTHFNVNSYDDEHSMNVTLLQGLVKVNSGTLSRVIRPGQQAQLGRGDIRVVNNIDTEEIMAWKNGLFHFEGSDIGSLMRQLSRWYNIEVVYEKQLNETFYAEMPRNTKLSDVLKFLELTGKVHFEIDGNRVTVMP